MMSRIFFILSLFTLSSAQCIYNKDLSSEFPTTYPPLLVDQATEVSIKAEGTSSNRLITISEGTTILVACPGSTIISPIGTEAIEATCTGGSLLATDGFTYDMTDFECSSRADDSAYDKGTSCETFGSEIFIGFSLMDFTDYETITVCFEDTTDYITLYANHIVYGKNVEAADSNPSRPSFKHSGFYPNNFDVNNCYLTANQESYFTQLTGDPNYIDGGANYFFSRGHLAPNAAFAVEMEADATFYYVNVIPQWQRYNGANWATVEDRVRDLASGRGKDLTIWTGPYGQQSLIDVNTGQDTPLYHCASQGENWIPIPTIIWKVVYDSDTDEALAVIESNVPYVYDIADNICEDIGCASNVPWLSLTNAEDITKGYTYCCSAQDLRNVVSYAPDLPTASLLLTV